MRLKVFSGATMQAVMADIRAELGEDAIIISNETGKTGVLVTAAVEQMREAPEREAPPAPAPARDMRDDRTAIDLESLRHVVDFHRLPERLATNLLRTTLSMDVEDGIFSLGNALDTMFAFHPLPEAPVRPLMVVGPPGAGKSTTTAKLAARAVLAEHDCLLISTDTVRTGAAAQLAAFADRLGQPHDMAQDGAALAALLDTHKDRVIFIDSLGINPFKADERSIIDELLGGSDVEPVLALPAGMDAEDAAEAAAALRNLGLRRIIGTRLDTGRRLGGLLAAADAAGLYFSDVTSSPFVGDGLDALTPITLARLMAHCSGLKTETSKRREAAT